LLKSTGMGSYIASAGTLLMAGPERLAEKVPGWVERLLIPTLETRVRTIVKEEVSERVGHLEKTMVARFDAVDAKFEAVDARFDAVNERIDSLNGRMDSLEGQIPMIQDLADLKARLAVVEKRTAR
jgi:chromosome segregation ATPase